MINLNEETAWRERIGQPDPPQYWTETLDDIKHHGQVRMAIRLADMFTGRLMFVHSIGWLFWDEKRWCEDDRGVAARAVLAVLKDALASTVGAKTEDAAALRRDATKCESATGIAGVLEIASKLKQFARTVADLDADPYLLNCANGTLDLRTMALRKHDPADRITKVCRAAYQPLTTSTAWSKFIDSVLPDESVRGFVQRVAGISLLGKVVEHILPIWTGVGANGKGTSYQALLWALGDYADAVEPELFMHREGAHPTGEADLRGLRLAVVSESDRDRKLAEATMKRLTGGDVIKARRMRQDFFSFEPSHTAVLITNSLPRVSGDDAAIWRRIRVVPFTQVFTGADQDNTLADQLRLAADSVLAWAVAGYRDYLTVGLAEPEAVKVATSAYQRQSDTIGRFLDECCLLSPAYSITTAGLHCEFEAWAAAEGLEPMNAKAFGRAMDQRGYETTRSNGKRVRRGIRVRIGAEVDTDE